MRVFDLLVIASVCVLNALFTVNYIDYKLSAVQSVSHPQARVLENKNVETKLSSHVAVEERSVSERQSGSTCSNEFAIRSNGQNYLSINSSGTYVSNEFFVRGNSLLSNIADITINITALAAQMNIIQADLLQRIDLLTASIANVNGSVSNFNDGLQSQLQVIQTSVDTLNQQTNTFSSTVSGLSSSLTNLSTTVGGIQSYPRRVVGPAATLTNGRIVAGTLIGLPAADQFCKNSFGSKARMCMLPDIYESMALNNALFRQFTGTYWMYFSGPDTGQYSGSSSWVNSCMGLTYPTGDRGRGTIFVFVDNTFGMPGGMSIDIQSNQACSSQRSILCCV